MKEEESSAKLKGQVGILAGYFIIMAFSAQYVAPYVHPIMLICLIGGLSTAHLSMQNLISDGMSVLWSLAGIASGLLILFSLFGMMIELNATFDDIEKPCDKLLTRMKSGEISGDVADTFTALHCPVAAKGAIRKQLGL